MLEIHVSEKEWWDETQEVFMKTPAATLQLEHSLVSLSKWEAKWQKPFLSNDDKTSEETLDYIRCMTINRNVKPYVYKALGSDNLKLITDYIASPQTATTITHRGNSPKGQKEIYTSEVIYYWMIMYGIPFECQKWHLNRLLTLIEVCNAKQNPQKMSRSAIYEQNKALNAARRAKMHSKG